MITLSAILQARILIVDDQPANVAVLEQMLEGAGYVSVTSTRNPCEVCDLHRRHRYDLILLDLQMPVMDGFQVMDGLQALEKDCYLPVLAITAQPTHKLRALKSGAKDFVSKPFDLAEVLMRVRNMIEVRLLHVEAELRTELVMTQSEEAIRTSELRYRRLFESAQDGIMILDAATGMVVDVNAFLIELLGYSHEQFLEKAVWELGFLKDHIANKEKFAVLREKEYVRYENLPLETVDGRRIEVEFVSNVYLVKGSRVIQCNVRDVTARRRAERALQLRETALGEVSQGVVICDENRLATYANASYLQITGYTQADILGRSCAIMQGPDTDPATIRDIRTALREEKNFEGEILNYRKDGTAFWNELSLSPIRDPNGGPTRFVGIQRDITERKLAGEALQKSEEHVRRERALLRTLIDSITDLIFLKDKDSVFLGCNKAFERHFDCAEEKLIGQSDLDFGSAEMAESSRRRDLELLDSGAPQRIEEWIPSKNGDGGFFETVKTPYYGPNGETLGIIAVSRDITGRKQAEENLRQMVERLKLAAEAGQVGIWTMDIVTQKMEWDAQMRILYGLPPDGSGEVISQIYSAMHPDDLPRVTIEFQDALQCRGKPLNTEYRIFRADNGGLRFIRAMATVIRNDVGEPQRIVGTNWDVTEERTREGKLAEALVHERVLSEKARAGDRAKSEFLAVMSHEIRTPMNGILGFSELLAGSPDLPVDCLDYVRTITSSGEALLRILDDILDFSRLEAGGVQIEKSLFSPHEILRDIQTLLSTNAGEKQLEFNLDAEGEGLPSHLWNDAGRLRQVLLNLTGNAIKFTASGSVTLGLRLSPGVLEGGRLGVDFFIRDTGPGIPEEVLGHIFEPFTQADSSISRRYGGTGLGLSISRNLVELMGGKLSVRSTVGKGSEFFVTLPIEVPAGGAPLLTDSFDDPLDTTFATVYPLRILLVEDDQTNRRLMLMTLHKLGYEPAVAQDGVEAVDACRRNDPDCILMDLQMPRKDGLQATREIREIERSAPGGGSAFIVAITANIVAEDRRQCFEVGMNSYINKPFKRSLLAQTLRQACEKNGHPRDRLKKTRNVFDGNGQTLDHQDGPVRSP